MSRKIKLYSGRFKEVWQSDKDWTVFKDIPIKSKSNPKNTLVYLLKRQRTVILEAIKRYKPFGHRIIIKGRAATEKTKERPALMLEISRIR